MPVQPGTDAGALTSNNQQGCPDAPGQPRQGTCDIPVKYPERPLRARRSQNCFKSCKNLPGGESGLLVCYRIQGDGRLGASGFPFREVAGRVNEGADEVQAQPSSEAGGRPDRVGGKVPADSEHNRSGRPLFTGHGAAPSRSVYPAAQPQRSPCSSG
jgi:hypothetical protein